MYLLVLAKTIPQNIGYKVRFVAHFERLFKQVRNVYADKNCKFSFSQKENSERKFNYSYNLMVVFLSFTLTMTRLLVRFSESFY